MNKFFTKLKQLLLYGGLEKEQYKLISHEINRSNRKSIIILSSACLAVYALRLCLTYSAVPDINRIVFLNAILLFGMLAVGNILVHDNSYFVHISVYLFMIFYLAVGIISAVAPASIHERTTLYLVFIVVAPMLYALNAVELAAIIVPSEIVYLLLIAKFQSDYPIYITNQGNSLFFSITGLLLGIYMANMKIAGIYQTYMNARTEEIKYLNKELAFHKQLFSPDNNIITNEPMSLPELFHDIRTVIQPEIDEKHLEFYIITENITNEWIIADNLQLQQVLLDLLDHSIKFTPDGSTIRFYITQKPSDHEGYAEYEFHIKDDGINISPKTTSEFIISLCFAICNEDFCR